MIARARIDPSLTADIAADAYFTLLFQYPKQSSTPAIRANLISAANGYSVALEAVIRRISSTNPSSHWQGRKNRCIADQSGIEPELLLLGIDLADRRSE